MRKYKVVQSHKVTIDGITYHVDLVQDDTVYNKYECTVLLFNDQNESVLTIDRFKMVYNSKENYYWSWTADLLTQLQKINLRNSLAEVLTEKRRSTA